MSFINALPGSIAEGLIWGLMAIGVYISYKILDIADLTVDGSICTGACVCVLLINMGVPAWLSLPISFLAGAATGILTGVLHTLFGIPSILAGILTQLLLYSVNLAINSGRSMVPLDFTAVTLLHSAHPVRSIIISVAIIALFIILLWRFFYTEIGLTLKSTGDNPDMSRAQGVNVKFNKVLGLAIANGIVAVAGALRAQYKGSANIDDGSGAIVIGLAALVIGLAVSTKIKPNFVVSLIGVVGGGIVYYIILGLATQACIEVKIPTNYLKMLSAIIVIVFLAIPYVKATYFTRPKPLPLPEESAGGEENA